MIPLAGSAYTYAYATLGELFAWIIGWDLTLEYAMGASTVSSGWSQPLHRTAGHPAHQDAVVAGVRSLDRSRNGGEGRRPRDRPRRPLAGARHASLPEQGFGYCGGAIAGSVAAGPRSAGAPRLFGCEIGFNLPAFLIALAITAILTIGIQESARFNATIVAVKVSVVLFVIGLGAMYVHAGNWGHSWSTFAPMGFSGIGAGAAYIFFAYIGFDAVSTTAQEAKNPQRDLPIGIIASLLICTVLYIAVAGVLTGMVPWQNINVEAPIARAFLDRGLNGAADVITLGALAGLTSVMLVMLLGQTRVLYAMANDGLLPRKFFAAIHPRFRTPWKNTILVGLLAAVVGSVTPISDIGKMVNIGTLLAFVIVCVAIMFLRRSDPHQPRPFRTPWVPVVPVLGILFNGYMMYKLGWVNWARLFGWLAIGLVVYFTYGRHHSRVRQAAGGNLPPNRPSSKSD